MLAALDSETIQIIHAWLKDIWDSGKWPIWLRQKHLCVLPEELGTVIHIDKVRPIMLIEILQKLWLRPLIATIRTAWQRNRILQPDQLGYLAHLSTEHGLIQFINALEHSTQAGSDLFFCSFDIAKAFDTVQRPLIDWPYNDLVYPTKPPPS